MHKLTQYLQNRQKIDINAGETFYHGGCYSANHNFEGHSWFARKKSYAAAYATWGAEKLITRDRIPYLSQFEVRNDFTVLLIEGNHIPDLKGVYGRAWNHAELARDTAEYLRKAYESAGGLSMAGLDDFLFIGFENTLNLVNSINDINLIREIRADS